MEQQEYEREIDLKNLLYYILCGWRWILLAALLCMAVMGVYKYVSLGGAQGAEASEQSSAAAFEQWAQDMRDGLAEPSKLTGDELVCHNLVLENSELDKEIEQEQFNLESSKSQLGKLEKQLDEYTQASSAGEENVPYDVRESILIYLISTYEKEQTAAECTIKTLEAKKAENEDSIDELIEALRGQKIVAVAPFRSAVKFAVAGFVGGAFIVAFILCLMYLFSGKLLDAGVLRDAHGLRLLSVIPVKRARKGIDGLIDKLNGHVFRTKEEAYDVIYGRMSNLAGDLKGKTVLVTGTADGSHVQELTEYLQAKDNAVKYMIFTDPLNNLDRLSMFRQADEILLVEQIGKSRLEEIRQEMYFMDDVKKRPLGVAVVE